MARKPRPSEIAAKAAKANKAAPKKSAPKAAKKAAPKRREAKHGGIVITRDDIIAAEQLNVVPPTIKLPSAKFVSDFVTKTLASLTTEKDSAVADIRNAHGSAQEKNHVESRAMSIAIRLHKMPNSKLYETMYHLAHYMAALDLWKRALEQGHLLDRKADESEDDAEGEGDGGMVLDGTSDKADIKTDPATAALPSGTPRMRIVDKEEPSTVDAMSDAIEKDEASKVA